MARYLIRMRRGIEARLALAVLALLAGCGEPAPPEEIHADVRGVVTSLAPAGPGHGVTLGVVRIAGGKQPDTRYGKAVLTVTTATRIYERQAFGQRQVSFADLRLGDKVEVHFAAPPPGPTAPAQPVAATAGEILILLRLGPPAYAVTPPSAPAPAPPASAATPGAPADAGGPDAIPKPRPRRPRSAATEPSVYFPPLPTPTPTPASTTAAVTPAALLRAVRAGPQPDADRAVFEFAGAAVPDHEVTWVDRPVHCGSGRPVPVAGTAWLQVRLHPAQAHDERGQPTAGPAARPPGLTVIRDLQPVCDAEGVVTWVLGLAAHREPRVFTLANPPRLVVDVAH